MPLAVRRPYGGPGGVGCSEAKTLQQLSNYLSPLATLLAVVLAYYFGRRQTIYERLYTRRAEVVAELFERFEEVDQQIFSLIRPFEAGGEPSKREKAKLASEGFNELQRYYRRNSIWLSPGSNRQLDDFLQRHKKPSATSTSM
jgi:hypothetical protein